MAHNIRVIARHHDPVIMNRLVRLLIAQAQTELSKRAVRGQQSDARRSNEGGAV